jgi:hypothetical protein
MLRSIWTAIFAIVALTVLSVAQAADLPTIDQALEKSKATGRPILAFAGSKDCAPCQALLNRLQTDRSLAPLVTQFVPLKLDTQGNDWQEWARKFPTEGGGIPILYVVRADGTLLYGKSGAKEGAELPLFMAEHLKKSGRIFSDEQLAALKSAVEESNKALADGDHWTAVKRIHGLSKLGTPGKFGSFATVAQEADALYAKLVEEGKAALTAAQEKLAGEDKFDGVLGVLVANRVFGNLPELKKDLVSAEREINKDDTLKDVLKQAEALDRALALAGNKTTKKSAPAAFELVMTRYPGTPAAELAKSKLSELGVEPAAEASDSPAAELRTWSDATGKFKIEAELIKVEAGKVELKRKDGQIVSVPLDKLSKEDQDYLAQLK